MVLTNPPFGKKSAITYVNEAGEAERESLVVAPRRLLGLDVEQAAQLRPAREDAAQAGRPRRGGRAGQRPLRGRRRRDGAAEAPARVRRPHAAAPADRDLLRAGREGERPLLRPQARERDAVDEGALDLRLPDEQALHAEAEPAPAGGSRRVRRGVQARTRATSARRASASSGSRTRSSSRATR